MTSKIERCFIKEKEAKKLLSEFFRRTKIPSQCLPELKPPIELAKTNNEEIFFANGKPIFAKSNNKLFPTLTSSRLLTNMPKAIVNMGAVPHICNGADIMAPGVVHFQGAFNKEDIVIVSDERHQKPIAVAIALYNIEKAKKLERGKILKNIHHIGDGLWNIIKQLDKTK
ncbi:MAG: DUF1947 domain-containing protein [Candidatus Bathyarchaeia archaeon]